MINPFVIMRACVHASVRVCMRAYMRVCERACVREQSMAQTVFSASPRCRRHGYTESLPSSRDVVGGSMASIPRLAQIQDNRVNNCNISTTKITTVHATESSLWRWSISGTIEIRERQLQRHTLQAIRDSI